MSSLVCRKSREGHFRHLWWGAIMQTTMVGHEGQGELRAWCGRKHKQVGGNPRSHARSDLLLLLYWRRKAEERKSRGMAKQPHVTQPAAAMQRKHPCHLLLMLLLPGTECQAIHILVFPTELSLGKKMKSVFPGLRSMSVKIFLPTPNISRRVTIQMTNHVSNAVTYSHMARTTIFTMFFSLWELNISHRWAVVFCTTCNWCHFHLGVSRIENALR